MLTAEVEGADDNTDVVRADGVNLFNNYTREVFREVAGGEELRTVAGCGFVLTRIATASLSANSAKGIPLDRRRQRIEALSAIKAYVKEHRAALARTNDADTPYPKLFMWEARRVLDDETYQLISECAKARQAEMSRRREVIVSSVGSALEPSGSSGAPKQRKRAP